MLDAKTAGIDRCRMAGGALGLAEEQVLPRKFTGRSLRRVKRPLLQTDLADLAKLIDDSETQAGR